MPLVRQDSTALDGQVSASRTHSVHDTEGQSPCAAYTRSSTHTRAVSVCSIYPGFGAHEAGSDVPTMPFLHSANADPRLPVHPTAAEAHPARSPCAVHIRDSAHTWPGPMCQQCRSFTTPMLIPDCRPTQPLLRHIRPGLCVEGSSPPPSPVAKQGHQELYPGTAPPSTQEAVLLCL